MANTSRSLGVKQRRIFRCRLTKIPDLNSAPITYQFQFLNVVLYFILMLGAKNRQFLRATFPPTVQSIHYLINNLEAEHAGRSNL